MTRRWALLLLLLLPVPLGAQELRDRHPERVQWRYDIGFRYYFDNREFAASQGTVVPSMTLHAAVLTPTVSAQLRSRTVTHGLTLGADLQHDMGSRAWCDFCREGILYYDARVRTGHGFFEGVAGIYPRRLLGGRWSEAFFSDQNLFQDRLFEGVLLKWRTPRFHAEAALDWLGQKGYDSKERFQVLLSGRWLAADWLSLGWNADYYHYAGSELAPGVAERYLAHFWAMADIAQGTGWQELSLKAGVLPSFQRDHRDYDHPVFPLGAEVQLSLRRWNLALQNTTYFGGDLQPYWQTRDAAGRVFAERFYFGSRFYSGFCDRIDLHWEPRLGRYARLRIGARAHFTADGFMGWQQVVSLRLDLGAPFGSRR